MAAPATGAQPFSLRGAPLLARGQTMTALAESGMLWLHLKIYAEGGENRTHNHPEEDHAFLILAGEAEFIGADGATRRLGRYDGILIPRGVAYRFRSVGEDNLVMVRAGAGLPDPGTAQRRGDPGRDPKALPAAMRVRQELGAPQGAPATDVAGAGVPLPGARFGID
jgi:mannose-6-phosphate isomerase-like protein (cupin superfamily)